MSNIILPAAVLAGLTIFMFFVSATAATIGYMRGAIAKRYLATRAGDPPSDAYVLSLRNYSNLVEMPLLFFSLVAIEVARGGGDALQIQLAWAYVGVRVAHSAVHVFGNYVPFRFLLFAASALILAGLWARLAMAVA